MTAVGQAFLNTSTGKTADVKMEKSSGDEKNIIFTCEADVKHYYDYAARANATMHLNHKPGEILQVDWAGTTAAIPAYVFVSAALPPLGV